jgi:hypothetical protein
VAVLRTKFGMMALNTEHICNLSITMVNSADTMTLQVNGSIELIDKKVEIT